MIGGRVPSSVSVAVSVFTSTGSQSHDRSPLLAASALLGGVEVFVVEFRILVVFGGSTESQSQVDSIVFFVGDWTGCSGKSEGKFQSSSNVRDFAWICVFNGCDVFGNALDLPSS